MRARSYKGFVRARKNGLLGICFAAIVSCGCGGGSSTTPSQEQTPQTWFNFDQTMLATDEGAGSVNIQVGRFGDGAGAADVDLVLSPLGATAGEDYLPPALPIRLHWAAGELGGRSASIPIQEDTTPEPDETFEATIAPLDPSHSVGARGVLRITIQDNDPFPTTDPMAALTVGGNLLRFDSGAPGTILLSVPVTGTQAGEKLLALDLRPADGRLYGLGDKDRIYEVDPDTGIASALRPNPFTTSAAGLPSGFDFNPLIDRIRVVNEQDINIRIRPSTATVDQTDTLLRYYGSDIHFGTDPAVVAIAYARRGVGPHDPQVYAIDHHLDILLTIGSVISSPPPDTGFLFTIGELGFDTTDACGFDIAASGRAYASLTAPGATSSVLARIDLETGSANLLGTIGGGEGVIGLCALTR